VAAPHVGRIVKALELAGISDAVFRRNARTGTPEVVPRGNRTWGQLNAELHEN
jgi:2,3,4,5-tetrahydropyridine-2-carboxylate N-succinyltransferase